MKPKNRVLLPLSLSLGLICASLAGTGCSKSQAPPPVDQGPIQKVRKDLSKGNYQAALDGAKNLSNQVPPGPFTEESLYLQGYILAYDMNDFRRARKPLEQLLGLYPNGHYAMDSQKLLADCQYWLGYYHNAESEYKKLMVRYGGRGLDAYALLQTAHCLLLDDKVGEALSTYREVVQKYPTSPSADWAQLMVANTYLKLQDYKKAKSELQKLLSVTQNPDVQLAARKALHQLAAEEPFRKGVGVPE